MALVVISAAGLVSGSLTGVVVDSEETAASSDERCKTSKHNSFAKLSERRSRVWSIGVSSTAVSSLSTAEATTETVFGCSTDCSGSVGLVGSAVVGSVDFTCVVFGTCPAMVECSAA
jgi:VCBS repeat-containing protein